MRRVVGLAAAVVALGAGAAQAQQQALAFVTCPMMRDTATVPCWLAEFKGEAYFLGVQGEMASAPSLGHQALIEGTPTGETRCGGKVLADLHVSVRPERDGGCDVIIPRTDAFQAGGAAAGGSASGGADPGHTPPPKPTVEGSLSRRFEVFYDFDWQTAGKDAAIIQEAAAYALANPAGEVHVTGYRGAVQLTGGALLAEEDGIDLRRTHELVDALVRMGIGTGKTPIFTKENPAPEEGDYTRRRAIIDIIFGGSDDHSEH